MGRLLGLFWACKWLGDGRSRQACGGREKGQKWGRRQAKDADMTCMHGFWEIGI